MFKPTPRAIVRTAIVALAGAAALLVATSAGRSAGEATATAQRAALPAAELAFRRGEWIYVMREDGTGLRRLVRGTHPSWSPDGRRLVFARTDRLYVIRADGSGERPLRLGRAFGPAWSPDGTHIAYTGFREGHFAVHVARADGSGARLLMRPGPRWEESVSPAWSPDGKRIVFASTRAGFFNPELYVARLDGTVVRRLTHTRGSDGVLGDDGTPDWSRDGRSIVFTSNRTDDGSLWLMRADGSRERLLVGHPESDEWQPRFSPDGRRIAFTRRLASGAEELWIVRANGAGARKLGGGGEAAWRPPAV